MTQVMLITNKRPCKQCRCIDSRDVTPFWTDGQLLDQSFEKEKQKKKKEDDNDDDDDDES